MNEMSRRAENGFPFCSSTTTRFSPTGTDVIVTSNQDALSRREQDHIQKQNSRASAGANAFTLIPPPLWAPPSQNHDAFGGAYLLQYLMPRSNAEDSAGKSTSTRTRSSSSSGTDLTVTSGQNTLSRLAQKYIPKHDPRTDAGVGVGASAFIFPPAPWNPPTQNHDAPKSKKLHVHRSTEFVPGWAVPPRVLLVDDDAVSRRLSSKFLQVFGCAIDVAVDGVGAVTKMNLEKYDLVLMDIVMPKMDGISATSLIRQFDHMTPIISMTSNSKPSEIMTYYSSGMNDILPKPFTKEGLLDMLEKHLMHLKVTQQTSKLPKPPAGVPPSSDGRFNEALAIGAASSSSIQSCDDDGRINPLAGMSLSDERFSRVGGVGEKRGLEEDAKEIREGKRRWSAILV
ncbi:CheY-like superfamily [Chiua virens]|nr:CheY-like superfamily [Chiua virens]